MLPVWLIELGGKFVFKKLKERAAKKAMTALKGKMTYSGVATFALPLLFQWLGVPLADSQLAVLVQALGVLAALFGNWRAKQNYGE